ncbi:hypothetical protein AB0L13_09405 [Saccharopolyspora shandongensis]|uniref:hypothetical protein n=1 Tax=Saccharopolyspora shandongensis TaxID=418495 RepID=UPI003437E19E
MSEHRDPFFLNSWHGREKFESHESRRLLLRLADLVLPVPELAFTTRPDVVRDDRGHDIPGRRLAGENLLRGRPFEKVLALGEQFLSFRRVQPGPQLVDRRKAKDDRPRVLLT